MKAKLMFSIAKDYSRTPGPRAEIEGKYSGENLRKNFLLNLVKEAIEEKKELIINLDGTAGYGTSFLEEVFGGLIREDNIAYEDIKKYVTIVSNEEPYLKDSINEYMDEANEKK